MSIENICEAARLEVPLSGGDAKALVDALTAAESRLAVEASRADVAEARLAHPIVACADRCAQNMPGVLYSGLTYVDDKLWSVRILSDEQSRAEDAAAEAGRKAREAVAVLAVLSGDPALDKMTPEQVAASAWKRVLDADSRADVAEQMVCELRALVGRVEAKAEVGWWADDHACPECVGDAAPKHLDGWMCARHSLVAIFSLTEPVVGRWVRPEDIVVGALHTRVGDAEKARDEVGIQLAAAQERLRLAMACIEAADGLKKEVEDADIVDGGSFVYRAWARYDGARHALDTVPGDALANCDGGVCGTCHAPVSVGCLCPPMTDTKGVR